MYVCVKMYMCRVVCINNICTHSGTFMTNRMLACHSPVHTYSGDELISFNQFSVFVIGAGGFGGNRTSNKAKVSTSNLPQPKSFSSRPGKFPLPLVLISLRPIPARFPCRRPNVHQMLW